MENLPESSYPMKDRASLQVQVIKALWCPTGDAQDDWEAFEFIAKCFAEYWNMNGKKTVSGAVAYINSRHIGETLERFR